tara:strand:+ start:562416 stop:563672 length:1257 start_codon:yes stop_codon:yes gene_type:complete
MPVSAFRDSITHDCRLAITHRLDAPKRLDSIVSFRHNRAITIRRIRLICVAAFVVIGVNKASESRADQPSDPSDTSSAAAQTTTAKYSPEVVTKAESILQDAGLKRTGRVFQSTETATISRALSSLNRTSRELRLVHKDWVEAATRVSKIGHELKRLNLQDGEYNLQLARVAGVNTAANNRLVGLINATRAKMKALRDEENVAKEAAAKKRAALNVAESEFATIVLAIRSDYRDLEEELRESLQAQDVQTAIKVMSANFQTGDDWTASRILAALDKRIVRIEQQIFSESIPLQFADNGSLYVNVVVGSKTARMVVDSGATLISLPARTAAELGIKIPADAPKLNLVLADGRTIPARRVTLDKVRVGQFEAEEVDAAILDASAIGSQPLLGMSYLGNFKFEINTPEKSLKMLRVAAEEL